jgi:hypothetical protein
MEKEKGNIELAGKVLEEAENILRKGNYRIGEGLDGTGLEATIVPKKTLAIKVPTTITEGSRIELKNNVYLWEVVGISGPRDFNTMYKDVQKLRCVALAKNIIMRYKEDVTDVKEILDIIDNCLEETYVYLEPLYNLYDPEEKDEERAVMPRYLSKSDLEDRIAKILPGEKADEDK